MKSTFEQSGFSFRQYIILDGRNADEAAKMVKEADFIILSGGHVPTQNAFFQKIGLKKLMKDFDGVVIGISAGSMNSADVVYSQPELEGEAIDPDYERFLDGLGLTQTMLIPHYQETKENTLDGMRLFEDITYPDSKDREFYAIPDGTYLYITTGKEELRGEAYKIADGELTQVTKDGESIKLR